MINLDRVLSFLSRLYNNLLFQATADAVATDVKYIHVYVALPFYISTPMMFLSPHHLLLQLNIQLITPSTLALLLSKPAGGASLYKIKKRKEEGCCLFLFPEQ